MKGYRVLTIALLLALALGVAVSPPGLAQEGATAQALPGTAFTYQGRLQQDGSPLTGIVDLTFSLWNAAAGGDQVGDTITDTVAVTGGLFTVQLDFGAGAFDGEARWLAVSVSYPQGSPYVPLLPRQALTPAPYALALPGLWTQQNATSPNLIGGHSGNWVTAGVYGATIGGGGQAGELNRVTDDYGTVAGGFGNQAGDDSGATDDQPHATVGGGQGNTASGWVATVAGGGGNTASGQSAVGGGVANEASGGTATIGGGAYNQASSDLATIGGGYAHVASIGYAVTIGGGYTNQASGNQATIGGGLQNNASGDWAAIPGGRLNVAAGSDSLAAGRRAKANHDGAFVWADSTDADLASTAANQFLVRASGGIWLGTTSSPSIPEGCFIGTSTGACLTTGGVWANPSDRNGKENLSGVDGRDVLARLAGVPISTWNYKAEDASVRHIGPMAQDFYAAFQVGEDDTHITTADADGVALAAIQGLYAENQGLKAQVGELEARVVALEELAGSPARPVTAGLFSGGWGPAGLVAAGAVVAWLARRRQA